MCLTHCKDMDNLDFVLKLVCLKLICTNAKVTFNMLVFPLLKWQPFSRFAESSELLSGFSY